MRRRLLLANELTGAKTVVPVMLVSRANGPVLIDGKVSGTANICETRCGFSPVLS